VRRLAGSLEALPAGGDVLEVTVTSVRKLNTAMKALADLASGEPHADHRSGRISVPVQGGASVLVDAVRVLDKARVRIDDLSLHRPSLDDVFLALTGRAAEGNDQEGDRR